MTAVGTLSGSNVCQAWRNVAMTPSPGMSSFPLSHVENHRFQRSIMFAVATFHDVARLRNCRGFGVSLSANPSQKKLIAFFHHFTPDEDFLEGSQMLDARRSELGRRNELTFHTQILACPLVHSKESISRPVCWGITADPQPRTTASFAGSLPPRPASPAVRG